MEAEDDDDLQLVRASAQLLADLETNLPKVLWKRSATGGDKRCHRYVRIRDYDYLINTLEPFQGEPQLLDPKLRVYLPQLLDAYLADLSLTAEVPPRTHHVTLELAVCGLLYTFCKVRGEKVISGFFPNEARHLDIILPALERSLGNDAESGSQWQVTYCLMLWLAHLLLTPFDLATISVKAKPAVASLPPCDIPENLQPLPSRIVHALYVGLRSRTKVQSISAKALVRLVNRPDLQAAGPRISIIPRACDLVETGLVGNDTGNSATGWMQFLVGLAAQSAGDKDALFLMNAWPLCQTLFETLLSDTSSSSAVHRKMLIKLLRNVAVAGIATTNPTTNHFLDTNGVLEEIIDYLLQSLSDRDTQVRFAAAKAIGIVVSRLDPDLASEVLQAIIESYNLYNDSHINDLSSRDPARWHGLTLALAHALFRRTALPDSLPAIISILLPALNFEQRAVTGNSLGTNVRDAACFAIWAISRRYTTAELLAVSTSQVSTARATAKNMTAIQFLAIQLMVAACLDPNGNVRRGCSAALQEMIGRHPDHVHGGIALIQIIDYQAVSLRRRALTELVSRAAKVHEMYWTAFAETLPGWRGLDSPDVSSREAAAGSLASLVKTSPAEVVEPMMSALFAQLNATSQASSVEQRHGALCALAAITDARANMEDMRAALRLHVQQTSARAFALDASPRSVAAEYPAALLRLMRSFTDIGLWAQGEWAQDHIDEIATVVSSSLSRSEKPLRLGMFTFTRSFLHQAKSYLPADQYQLVRNILPFAELIKQVEVDSSRMILHGAARVFALAAAFGEHELTGVEDKSIVQCLAFVASAPVIEWRVIGFRGLCLVIEKSRSEKAMADDIQDILSDALSVGLNDYTITERGDVGSLARTQALICVQAAWRGAMLEHTTIRGQVLYANVLRLSLEKLDRVRLLAAQVLAVAHDVGHDPVPSGPTTIADVSSYEYFAGRLAPLSDANCPEWRRDALLRGLSSSAGGGAEALLQTARAALTDLIGSANAFPAPATILAGLSALLKHHAEAGSEPTATLDLLAFALDYTRLAAIAPPNFPWRALLSRVQKAHFKSTSTPRLVAAVGVYRSLGGRGEVRREVLAKLAGMLRSNPFPRVRYDAAEALWCLTGEAGLRAPDWSRSGRENAVVLDRLGLRLE